MSERSALRAAGSIATIAGAIGSVALFLYAGRSAPRLLLVPFAVWVASPYALLWITGRVSARWPAAVRTTLDVVSLTIAFVSLAVYATAAFGPAQSRPAPYFVMVPPLSWLVIAAACAAAWISARRAR